MAEITAIPRNNLPSRFEGNDACSRSLVNLEISEESPPKYDFDVNLLSSDNEINWKEQSFDKDNEEKKNNVDAVYLLSEDTDIHPTTNMTAVVSNNISLGALAQDHLENNKTFLDLCSDVDFCFLNARPRDTENCLNGFDQCVNTQANSNTKFLKMPESDIAFDLSELMLESVYSTPIEGSFPHSNLNKDLSCESNKDCTDAFLSSLKIDNSDDFLSFDSFRDILQKENVKDVKSSIEIDKLYGLECSSSNCSESSVEKKEFCGEITDDDLVPDIDLNFCIKKNIKNEFSIDSSSPDSVDSGFCEMSSTQKNFISDIFNKNVLYSDLYPHRKEEKIKFKQSLFSRAISAKPKVNPERENKLKQITIGFFKQRFPPAIVDFSYQKQQKISDKNIDFSDACIVTSNFLKITGQKSLF